MQKHLNELIDLNDPGWPLVQEWIAAANKPVEVLPPTDDSTREKALVNTQVTTRSPLGAIIYETGGILVDHGWLRILGSGHPRLPRSLPNRNFGRTIMNSGDEPSFLLCADDVIGGFFAIDGGGLGFERGKVCYFAPGQIAWENTYLGYSQFLTWCFQGDLATYYETERWPNWEEEVSSIRGDQALFIFPPLWAEGPPIGERKRDAMSVAEIYGLQIANHK